MDFRAAHYGEIMSSVVSINVKPVYQPGLKNIFNSGVIILIDWFSSVLHFTSFLFLTPFISKLCPGAEEK